MQTGMRFFHRRTELWKEEEYLLITQSFPHSPQVSPQELSTVSTGCGYAKKVHIKGFDLLRGISHFWGTVDFAMGKIFVRISHLDKGVRAMEKEGDGDETMGSEKNRKKDLILP